MKIEKILTPLQVARYQQYRPIFRFLSNFVFQRDLSVLVNTSTESSQKFLHDLYSDIYWNPLNKVTFGVCCITFKSDDSAKASQSYLADVQFLCCKQKEKKFNIADMT